MSINIIKLCLIISSSIFLTACECDCKVDYRERVVNYQCADKTVLVTYINENKRIDEPKARIQIDEQNFELTLVPKKSASKNYYSNSDLQTSIDGFDTQLIQFKVHYEKASVTLLNNLQQRMIKCGEKQAI